MAYYAVEIKEQLDPEKEKMTSRRTLFEADSYTEAETSANAEWEGTMHTWKVGKIDLTNLQDIYLRDGSSKKPDVDGTDQD